jgi:hypothetical protein
MILRIISDITSDIVDAAVDFGGEVVYDFVVNWSCAERTEALA